MNILEFIYLVLGVLVWPVTLLICLAVFRSELKGIGLTIAEQLKRLRKLTVPGGMTASFDDELWEARSETEEIYNEITEEKPGMANKLNDPSDVDEIKASASLSPRGAIVEAWVDLEESMRQLALSLGLPDASRSVSRLTKKIMGETDDSQIRDALHVVRNLQHLRNKAVHDRVFQVSTLAAYEFASTASSISRLVRIKAEEISLQRAAGSVGALHSGDNIDG